MLSYEIIISIIKPANFKNEDQEMFGIEQSAGATFSLYMLWLQEH